MKYTVLTIIVVILVVGFLLYQNKIHDAELRTQLQSDNRIVVVDNSPVYPWYGGWWGWKWMYPNFLWGGSGGTSWSPTHRHYRSHTPRGLYNGPHGPSHGGGGHTNGYIGGGHSGKIGGGHH